MTQKEFFNAIITGTLTEKVKTNEGTKEVSKPAFENDLPIEELVNFAKDKVSKIDEKNKKRSEGTTQKQEDNEVIKNAIVAAFQSDGKDRTARMVAEEFEGIKSTQHAGQLLIQLEKSGVLTSYMGKLNSSSKVKIYNLKTAE